MTASRPRPLRALARLAGACYPRGGALSRAEAPRLRRGCLRRRLARAAAGAAPRAPAPSSSTTSPGPGLDDRICPSPAAPHHTHSHGGHPWIDGSAIFEWRRARCAARPASRQSRRCCSRWASAPPRPSTPSSTARCSGHFHTATWIGWRILNEVGPNGQQMSVSWPNFLDWQQQNDMFDELGIYRGTPVSIAGMARPTAQRLPGVLRRFLRDGHPASRWSRVRRRRRRSQRAAGGHHQRAAVERAFRRPAGYRRPHRLPEQSAVQHRRRHAAVDAVPLPNHRCLAATGPVRQYVSSTRRTPWPHGGGTNQDGRDAGAGPGGDERDCAAARGSVSQRPITAAGSTSCRTTS